MTSYATLTSPFTRFIIIIQCIDGPYTNQIGRTNSKVRIRDRDNSLGQINSPCNSIIIPFHVTDERLPLTR